MEALLQGAIINGWTTGNPEGGLPREDAVWCGLDGEVGVREVLGFGAYRVIFKLGNPPLSGKAQATQAVEVGGK